MESGDRRASGRQVRALGGPQQGQRGNYTGSKDKAEGAPAENLAGRWSKASAFHRYEMGNHDRASSVTIADQRLAVWRVGYRVELPDLANKNTECPVKLEHQINKSFCSVKYTLCTAWDILMLKMYSVLI